MRERLHKLIIRDVESAIILILGICAFALVIGTVVVWEIAKYLLRFFFLSVIFMGLFTSTFYAQDKQAETGKDCLNGHETRKDLFDNLRLLPAKVISYDIENKLVFWKFEDKTTIHLGSLKAVSEGNYEPNFYANTDQVYMMLWCSRHLILWQVVKYNPKGKK